MISISHAKCIWVGLAILALAFGLPARAQSGFDIASRNELATLLLNAEETRLAERRQANVALAEQRRQIAARDTQIAGLRSELGGARNGQRQLQERLDKAMASSVEAKLAYTEALARKDADYARELRILRESGEKLLETEDGREALRLYNTGDPTDWQKAKVVLEQIDRTREEVESRERTDRRRSIAALYRDKRAKNQETTAATLDKWERVVEGGAATAADWNSLAELQRDFFQFDKARKSVGIAVDLADNPLDRARSEIELARILLEREEHEPAGKVVASAIKNARAAHGLAPESRDALLTLLTALNLADDTRPADWGDLVAEARRLVDAAAPDDPVLVAWKQKVRFSAKLEEIDRTHREWKELDRNPRLSRSDPIVATAMERSDRTERSVFAFCQGVEQVTGADTASWLWVELVTDCYLRSAFERDIYDDMVIGAEFFPERLEKAVALLRAATARDPSNRRALYKLGRDISRVYAETAGSMHFLHPNPALYGQGVELLENLARQTGDPMVNAELADALQESLLRSLREDGQRMDQKYLAQMGRVLDLRYKVILSQPDNAGPITAALKSFNAMAPSFEHWGMSEDVFLAKSRKLLDFIEPRVAALGQITDAERLELLEPLLEIHRDRCFKDDYQTGPFFHGVSFRFTTREQLLPCLKAYVPVAKAAYAAVQKVYPGRLEYSHYLAPDMAMVMWVDSQLAKANRSLFTVKLLDLMDFVTRTRDGNSAPAKMLYLILNDLLAVAGADNAELRVLLDAQLRSFGGDTRLWPRLVDGERTMSRIRALALSPPHPAKALKPGEAIQPAKSAN